MIGALYPAQVAPAGFAQYVFGPLIIVPGRAATSNPTQASYNSRPRGVLTNVGGGT